MRKAAFLEDDGGWSVVAHIIFIDMRTARDNVRVDDKPNQTLFIFRNHDTLAQ
ncbi:MAG: hypothetical protein ABIJ31_00020 [Pseudomonadota bacterium]